VNQQIVREDSNLIIAKALEELTKLVKEQGKEIAELKTIPVIPSKDKRRGLQSQSMKNKWANPAFREKMKNRRKGKKEESEVKEEA